MFSHSLVSPKNKRTNRTLGFSLVELLVSIGIVVLVLSIVVARQQSFNSSVLLRGQAYEIALAMREVQLGAVSAVGDGGGDFRATQGIYFSIFDNQEYKVFRDANNNQFYNSGEEIGFSGTLDPRFEIQSIEPGSVGEEISIVFKRPNFDAVFVRNGAGRANSILNETSVLITVAVKNSAGNVCGQDIRQIEVRSTGQISVVEC